MKENTNGIDWDVDTVQLNRVKIQYDIDILVVHMLMGKRVMVLYMLVHIVSYMLYILHFDYNELVDLKLIFVYRICIILLIN